MTYEQIETFLTVVTCGSITAAANELFVTQSTVSSRIQGLEAELGAPLLIRAKGHRNVELTSYGQAFVPIASQWTSLWKHTQKLKTAEDTQVLTIASIDSVNNYTLVRLFNQHIHRYPNIKLRIHTHHSNEIHGLVQNRVADIGFVFSRVNYPNIISRPVYRELMYLICRKDGPYHEGIACTELSTENEVFLRWGQDYQQWHDRHWSPELYPAITVNTGSTLQRFLDAPERWAIAPMSIIHQLSHNSGLTYYRLQTPPPPRICYEIRNRYPTLGQQKAIDLFHQELEAYIDSNSDICTFEDWMLRDSDR
ncbi:MAG: LysR family transcriptional regulator [Oscillospiraceae bacterium]|nr:LysR family transcriptional regulator [Oscillospiraceae bacterium]